MSLLVDDRRPAPASPDGGRPLVSILTPAFNEERHLAGMIDSVRAQTWTAFELLVVDDGSSDRTAEIAREAAAADDRIRLVASGTRLGKVAAFNAAFESATGDIVCHIGGDDTVPPDALAHRVRALEGLLDAKAVAFFKLRIDSGGSTTVIPRGPRGSMSGPSITMTRPLADLVMPVPGHLVSEDIWMGHAADALAEVRVDSDAVVVNYRRHEGNSNPRNKSFPDMDDAIHRRMQALTALAETDRFALPDHHRGRLAAEIEAERRRHAGRTWDVLRSDLPMIDRLAVASMSHPALWRVRQSLLTPLTGWRGR